MRHDYRPARLKRMEAADTMTLGMFVTLAALIVGSIWNQHRESNAARAENTRQIERLGDQFGEQLGTLSEVMSTVRERLARIEGHLRLAPPPTGDLPDRNESGDSD